MHGDEAELRLTPQRRAVLAVLRASPDHPTAGEVFDRVRNAVPGIGAATVYRALSRLVDAGLAQELSLGDGSSARYDARVGQHDHVVCVRCGHARDLPARVPAAVLAEVATATGFTVDSYDLQFHGLCPDCAPPRAPGGAASQQGQATSKDTQEEE